MKENEGAADGEQLSVSSPRRILSFKKDKRKNVTFPDGDETGFGVSREYGLKSSEVHGFVGSITTVVATAIFLVWAYVPETWLNATGIHYYPSRCGALALPTYVTVTVLLALSFTLMSLAGNHLASTMARMKMRFPSSRSPTLGSTQ